MFGKPSRSIRVAVSDTPCPVNLLEQPWDTQAMAYWFACETRNTSGGRYPASMIVCFVAFYQLKVIDPLWLCKWAQHTAKVCGNCMASLCPSILDWARLGRKRSQYYLHCLYIQALILLVVIIQMILNTHAVGHEISKYCCVLWATPTCVHGHRRQFYPHSSVADSFEVC